MQNFSGEGEHRGEEAAGGKGAPCGISVHSELGAGANSRARLLSVRVYWNGGRALFVANGARDRSSDPAKGGGVGEENLRVLCRAHNLFSAAREFGEEFMRGKIEGNGDLASSRLSSG